MKLFNQLQFINSYLEEYGVEINISSEGQELLTEAQGATYYNVRQFVTLIYRHSNDAALKKMVKELLKTLAILEVKNKPVPTIQKLKTVSPLIFPIKSK